MGHKHSPAVSLLVAYHWSLLFLSLHYLANVEHCKIVLFSLSSSQNRETSCFFPYRDQRSPGGGDNLYLASIPFANVLTTDQAEKIHGYLIREALKEPGIAQRFVEAMSPYFCIPPTWLAN